RASAGRPRTRVGSPVRSEGACSPARLARPARPPGSPARLPQRTSGWRADAPPVSELLAPFPAEDHHGADGRPAATGLGVLGRTRSMDGGSMRKLIAFAAALFLLGSMAGTVGAAAGD